jgi:hypothetical protein
MGDKETNGFNIAILEYNECLGDGVLICRFLFLLESMLVFALAPRLIDQERNNQHALIPFPSQRVRLLGIEL